MSKIGIKLYTKKLRYIDILLCTIMTLALGFRTNCFPFEKNISTMLIVVLFIFLIICNHGRLYIKLSMKYIIWYTVVVGVCTVSVLWAKVNVKDYIYSLIKDTYVPLFFVLLAIEYYLVKTKNPIRIVNTLIVAELITIARAIIYTPWIEMLQTLDSRLFASGLGQNYNDFTTQMTLVAIVIAFLGFNVEKKYNRLFWTFMLLIFISGSRKAIVVSILSYFILYLLSAGHNAGKIIKRVFVLMVLAASILAIIFTNNTLYNLIGVKLIGMVQSLGLSSSEIRSFINAQNIDHSMHGRAVLREQAWMQFKNNPILGIGYYNFQYTNTYGLYAHNNYLELLADLGVVGFVTYYSIYIFMLTKMSRKLIQGSKDIFYKFVIVFLGMLLILEYAQITFFRLFALVPLVSVFMWADFHNKLEVEN